ncbi:MAG TPA: hypothetical protein PLG20_03550 [Candidatus Syntrophosphaera sp.]|jgi:hypothetical protein|nr:hypothetical protein [Candidatus Syntrophosphaera sp.]
MKNLYKAQDPAMQNDGSAAHSASAFLQQHQNHDGSAPQVPSLNILREWSGHMARLLRVRMHLL